MVIVPVMVTAPVVVEIIVFMFDEYMEICNGYNWYQVIVETSTKVVKIGDFKMFFLF